MVSTVAKRRTNPDKPKPKRSPAYTVYARINPALGAALDLKLSRSRRSLTAELELALEAWLAADGLWPPPDTD